MNKSVESLRTVSLFSDLSDDDLERLCERSDEIELPAGETLFAEGDAGDQAYVIIGGEIEILKLSSDRDVLLAVRQSGEVIGEMALLQEEPRSASAVARTDARLISIPKAALDELLLTSASAARALFDILLQRWRDTEAQLRQSERMAQLGTLTAGLAHELNNPAAAVRSSADQLLSVIADYGEARQIIGSLALATVDDGALHSLLGRARDGAPTGFHLDPLARSDRESELGDWISDRGVEESWLIAPAFTDLGVTIDDLDRLADEIAAEALPQVLQVLRTSAEAHQLLREMAEGATRVSSIVKALKSYSYLDQAPVQDVDVAAGIDDTLLILKSKTSGITVLTEYAADLPQIEAYGSELNQVWTNLIDNATDAIRETEREDGVVTIRAFAEDDRVVVEVEDNGAGIPAEIQHRVFDSFFTTKPPGSGTGLGLDISFGIVVNKHGGDLKLSRSQPGATVFRVELPTHAESAG